MAKSKRSPPAHTGSIHPHLTAISLFLIAAVFAMMRMRLLDLPLERDEGEYAYAGQLILHGIPPYRLMYNMKWPGTYAMYAAMMGIFGHTITGIRIGMILITSATAVCLYFLTARMFGRVAGVVAAATNLLLSITLASLGTYGHATHFVALFAVAGLMLLVHARPAIWSALGAGALLALCALMKQPGMVFGFFAAAWLLLSKRVRDTAAVAGGAAIVAVLTVAMLTIAGVFDRFKLWTIDYARQYISQITPAEGLEMFKQNFGAIYSYTPLLWWIALAGLVLLFVDAIARKHWPFVIGFTIAGALATSPGLYFRSHYFLVLFPAIAMLNGIAVTAASRLIPWRAAAPLAYAVAFIISLGNQWPTLMRMDAMSITRMRYGINPFPEAIDVANYIKEHSDAADRIAVIGSEPEIYFYAGRKSATGYIYTYPLMEKQSFAHHMQQEMIAEIEQAKPKYIVTVSVPVSWLARPDSDRTIFEWSEKYISANYTLDGIADLLPNGTEYHWGAEAAQYQPRTGNVLMVFRRK
ncbi:MAG TPA: glycosyltransferase family 39 protein [Thermoanaerobaculia bacterium]